MKRRWVAGAIAGAVLCASGVAGASVSDNGTNGAPGRDVSSIMKKISTTADVQIQNMK
jgi:hypothetical protein